MTYSELQDRLHGLIFKAAWDQDNFTEEEKQEVLMLQEKQKDYDEYYAEEALKNWYRRNM
mgnify:CR=1 FL=1|jgi:predicted patatin/cPLA2 family phospholipase